MKNKPILIVTGEPKSVFFEIFFKSIKLNRFNSPLILICNIHDFKKQIKKFNYKKKFKILSIDNLKKNEFNNKQLNLLSIASQNSSKIKFSTQSSKKYILDSFELAFKLINDGFTYKLINGPINKKKFLNNQYPGVTEYVAHYFNKKKIGMLIFNSHLSVCPLTTHLPLKLIPKKITKKLIVEKINIINDFYRTNFKFKPKIGVTGLNPHCESILKYNEDEKIVSSAIKSLVTKKINVKGPFPADTIFLKNNRKKFDVILGMYHDQVLAPIKTLFEYDAINITMGLPFLRVSPDHGTNEKMIGKNKSNPVSLIKALNFLDQR